MQIALRRRFVARTNQRMTRLPGDWFPPVRPTGVPTSTEVDEKLALVDINTTAPLTGGGNLSADRTLAINAATGAAAGSMSAADKTKLDAISGTNTGDQTSIAGITGTKAQFDAALSDGDFLFAGALINAVDDAAAATAGVAVNGLYRNGSVVMIRVT